MRQLWIKVSGWASVAAVAAVATGTVALGMASGVALAQMRPVPIPPKAQRADIIFNGSPMLVINGKPAQLAPGGRIFNRQNMIVTYGAVNGGAKAKFLREDGTGLVMSVWILTEDEIAVPDPKP